MLSITDENEIEYQLCIQTEATSYSRSEEATDEDCANERESGRGGGRRERPGIRLVIK